MATQLRYKVSRVGNKPAVAGSFLSWYRYRRFLHSFPFSLKFVREWTRFEGMDRGLRNQFHFREIWLIVVVEFGKLDLKNFFFSEKRFIGWKYGYISGG